MVEKSEVNEDQPNPPCPKCNGERFVFTHIDEAVRWQQGCQYCGGTGLYSDSVARALSGEDQFSQLPTGSDISRLKHKANH